MWNTAAPRTDGETVCYIFHHWSGRMVDRSEIVVSDASCTPVPREEYDEEGLPAWYLFRSIPQRLCPHAGDCAQCSYVLGSVDNEQQETHPGFALVSG